MICTTLIYVNYLIVNCFLLTCITNLQYVNLVYKRHINPVDTSICVVANTANNVLVPKYSINIYITWNFCLQLQRENLKLSNQIDSFTQLSQSINLNKRVQWTPVEEASDNNLIIWLSDMHIGCRVDDNSLYPNH